MTRMTMTAATVAGVLLAGTTLVRWDTPSRHDAHARARAKARHAAFEENLGQHDARARYVARGANFSLFVTDRDVTLALPVGTGEPPAAAPARGVALRLAMVGARGDAAPVAEAPLAHRVNYLKGRDPAGWVTGVRTYGRVRQGNLRPGVDVVWYASDSGTLEYDVVVAPAVDPSTVEFDVDGAERLELTAAGTLRIHTDAGVLEQDRPVAYQDDGGSRTPVASAYDLRGPGRVGFAVGAYDDSRPLVIDPTLSQLAFATYVSGSTFDSVHDLAVDGARNVYVAGKTQSADFPVTAGSFDVVGNGSPVNDLFVTKLNAAATTAIYSTYLGGSQGDQSPAIAVDAAGRAYVVGYTSSADYPITPGALDTVHYSNGFPHPKAVVTLLAADGASLVYSTFLGGTTSGPSAVTGSWATDVTVDAAGNAYVVGMVSSADFPVTIGAFDTTANGGRDIFVSKLNPSGSALIFSTRLGGSGDDASPTVALAAGNVVVAGGTNSLNFPTTAGALDTVLNAGGPVGPFDGYDGFVSILNSTGTALMASTYLGGTASDSIGTVLFALPDPFVYVGGSTESANFPTTAGAFDQTPAGSDGFVAKLPLSLGSLVYSTRLGGTSFDRVSAIVAAPRPCVPGFPCPAAHPLYVGGTTWSADFPVSATTFDGGFNGNTDAFVALLDRTGSAVGFSTFFGGTGAEMSTAAASDGVGNVFIAGSLSGGSGFPIAGDGVFQKARGNETQVGFVAKFGTYVVSGRVLNAAGQPVPGVTVTASQGFSASTTTDALGFYVLDTPPTGSYRVTPSLPGATFSPAFRQFTNPQSNRVANFTRLP